jgi:hypothetical protein
MSSTSSITTSTSTSTSTTIITISSTAIFLLRWDERREQLYLRKFHNHAKVCREPTRDALLYWYRWREDLNSRQGITTRE